jgi:hypothetical protein
METIKIPEQSKKRIQSYLAQMQFAQKMITESVMSLSEALNIDDKLYEFKPSTCEFVPKEKSNGNNV